MNRFSNALYPNRPTSATVIRLFLLGELGLFLLAWISNPSLPTPSGIISASSILWSDGLVQELLTSMLLNLQALGIATLVSLAGAYATTLGAFRALGTLYSKFRFMSMVGLSFMFTVITGGGRQLQVTLMVFAVSVFFLTSMKDIVDQVPKEQYDLARTMGMNEWRAFYEVVVLGTADKAFDALRQNAAIGWMMLTLVEGMVRSEGGIGTVLLNQNKHFNLDAVFAIQVAIILLGLGQDYLFSAIKKIICPYAALTLERK